jgi:hypothetical protein
VTHPYACPSCCAHFLTISEQDDVPVVTIAPTARLSFNERGHCTALCGSCGQATPLVLSRLLEAEVEHVWRRQSR